jgi:hypothetical protein
VCLRSNGSQAQQSTPMVSCNVNSAQTVRAESKQRQKPHRTVKPVQCDTGLSGGLGCQSSNDRNRQNPNGWVTWLAHRIVPVRPSTAALPNDYFGGWGYKYPQPPLFKASMFPAYCIQYKSSRLHSKTQTRDQILSQVHNHSKHLVTSEREIFVFI